jgi:major membrane immunogen (membrane-anchored lipoprotein)
LQEDKEEDVELDDDELQRVNEEAEGEGEAQEVIEEEDAEPVEVAEGEARSKEQFAGAAVVTLVQQHQQLD